VLPGLYLVRSCGARLAQGAGVVLGLLGAHSPSGHKESQRAVEGDMSLGMRCAAWSIPYLPGAEQEPLPSAFLLRPPFPDMAWAARCSGTASLADCCRG